MNEMKEAMQSNTKLVFVMIIINFFVLLIALVLVGDAIGFWKEWGITAVIPDAFESPDQELSVSSALSVFALAISGLAGVVLLDVKLSSLTIGVLTGLFEISSRIEVLGKEKRASDR